MCGLVVSRKFLEQGGMGSGARSALFFAGRLLGSCMDTGVHRAVAERAFRGR
jgi:hypothetical protein